MDNSEMVGVFESLCNGVSEHDCVYIAKTDQICVSGAKSHLRNFFFEKCINKDDINEQSIGKLIDSPDAPAFSIDHQLDNLSLNPKENALFFILQVESFKPSIGDHDSELVMVISKFIVNLTEEINANSNA